MESNSPPDERLTKALRVLAINQDKDFRGLPIKRVLLEKDSTSLVVVLQNINGPEEV